MEINVRADLDGALLYLRNLQREQIPFATAYALTQTAKDAQTGVIGAMRTNLDSPKPYTLQGTYVIPATKSKLQATVKLKDGYQRESLATSKRGTADKYLRPQVEGGPRRNTAFERALIHNGLMPPGYFAVPTRLAPRDANGNVPAGIYNRIMSQLQIGDEFQRKRSTPKPKAATNAARRAAEREKYKSMSPLERQAAEQRKRAEAARRQTQRRAAAFGRPKARPKYPIFNVYPKRQKNRHLSPGIYERIQTGSGSTVRPLFIYVDKAPTYKMRLPFFKVVQESIVANLASNFNKGFRIAAATATGTVAQQTDALLKAGISDYMGGTLR